MSAPSEGQFFKVKLSTGRILGPLDLDRVRLLIQKNQITGQETARRYPQGEWEDINAITEIAELLVKKAAGDLSKSDVAVGIKPPASDSLPTTVLPAGPTQVLPSATSTMDLGSPPPPTREMELEERTQLVRTESPSPPSAEPPLEEEEKTKIAAPPEPAAPPEKGEGTQVISNEVIPAEMYAESAPRSVANEATVVFDRSAPTGSGGGTRTIARIRVPDRRSIFRGIIVAAALGLLVQEMFFPEVEDRPTFQVTTIRPKLPISSPKGSDPQLSQKLHLQGMHFYVQDTVPGYRTAADYFLQAASYDINNVKSLAMLASSYLNLVDSSAKDENYFVVISKLIEMSRAKAVELLETVIADVEFYVVTNRPEAAQNRIVEFTKTSQQPDMAMFFYLAYAHYSKGDASGAARYLNQLPDNKIPTPKFFHYRGLVAEMLNDPDSALAQYQKAIQLGKNHARSRLRIADIYAKRGKLKDAAPYLDFLVNNPTLLSPRELALAYYLHSQLNGIYQKWNLALGDIERSVRLDPANHDYVLEMYTLRAKLGETSPEFQKEARMYFFLGEGEKQLKEGRYQEALTSFLKARQANLADALPLRKIGDMFLQMNDVQNAKLNYQHALERAPNNVEIASKYLEVLIRSYDWDTAEKFIQKLRGMRVNQGLVDKAQGDLYAQQGQFGQAAVFYKKAMAREVIDPSVYTAFAGALAGARNCKDAPFFYSLALRFDPQNTDAVIGIARCKAETESIDQAIAMLQDELQKIGGTKAELLAAIAELQSQKGEWAAAQSFVDQAIRANPDYAQPWKIQARIHLAKESTDRNAIQNALAAYQSYIDRNPNDPAGYYEKHRIYVKKLDYGAAETELAKIAVMYPNYPLIHFHRGNLYAAVGNFQQAVAEYAQELKKYPHSQPTLVAMGKAQIHLNAPDEALKHLNTAMALTPGDVEAKLQAAEANYILKNFAGAAALFETASQLDPGNPQIYKRLGLAHRESGNSQAARRAFQKYLEMEPDAPDRGDFQSY